MDLGEVLSPEVLAGDNGREPGGVLFLSNTERVQFVIRRPKVENISAMKLRVGGPDQGDVVRVLGSPIGVEHGTIVVGEGQEAGISQKRDKLDSGGAYKRDFEAL